MKFESSSNVARKGFTAFIHRIDDNCQYWKNLDEMILSSPNYPKWYNADGVGCEWLISVPEGFIVALEFNHFHLWVDFEL
jgi:hypothetical protein